MAGDTSRVPQDQLPIGTQAVAPLVYGGVKTNAELLADLQEAVRPLVHLKCDTSIFTPIAVNSMFLTVKLYIRLTRVFLSISDPAVLKQIVLASSRAGTCDLSVADGAWKLGPEDVLKISEWMKSPEGGDCMRLIYKKRKLERKLEKKVRHRSAAKQLHEEYEAERKEIESSYEKEIDCLLRETQRSRAVESRECLKRKREHCPEEHILVPGIEVCHPGEGSTPSVSSSTCNKI